ncbi:hypothetical protein H0264_13085 [Nocardia huaxiensis]|uniref:Lipoprotein n=1 Tax=Nocardia huaxiensis TaxID=2755382 RepID=A0A7D6ZK35_9NOCA|nr:hypothetical protein [Nocardia huaxiensis]QLY33039.1 hypothetical protein H0264_13085 [Nocardia huaxiensis]
MRIKQTIGATLAAVALITGLTACGSDSVSESPAAERDPLAAMQPLSPATSETEILGPTGYRGLDLGADWTEETARNNGKPRGILDDGGTMVGCAGFRFWSTGNGYLNDGKVVALFPDKSAQVRTPEGIKIGSTVDQVRDAYPTLRLGVNWSSAAVPDQPGFHYGFMGITQSGKGSQTVTALLLYSDQDTCHN